MANHPNRSNGSGPSYVVMLPKANRLWKHVGAAQEALFSRPETAQRCIDGLSGRGAIAGAKIMRIIAPIGSIKGAPPEEGAVAHSGWWLIEI